MQISKFSAPLLIWSFFLCNWALGAPLCRSTTSNANQFKVAPNGPKLVIAANRLPVTVVHSKGENDSFHLEVSGGGLVSALASYAENFHWVGWPGASYPVDREEDVTKVLAVEKRSFQMSPVFMSGKEKTEFYDRFSNQILWPVFHNLKDNVVRNANGWQDYQEINKRFAQNVFNQIRGELEKPHSQKEIFVWIHDYQLLLVPSYLKALIENEGSFKNRVRIGFFLHIPFPRLESFRLIPSYAQQPLLEGLLGADRIGFQSQRDQESFKAVTNALGLQSRLENTEIWTHPIGINPNRFRDVLKLPSVQQKIGVLEKRYEGYKIFLGVERLDPIKGLVEKLKGYELFLEKNPEFHGKTILLQVAQPSRLDIPEYQRLTEEVRALANGINNRFTIPGRKPPVELLNQGFGIEDVVAFYYFADCTVITSLADGMNLVASESVSVQQGRKNPSTLILSQETGAASHLKGSLVIAPRDSNQLANAMRDALRMSPAEKRRRVEMNLNHVNSRTADQWVKDFTK